MPAEASRGISLPNMKSDPIFWERGREKEEKYFIKKHLTPVWVPPLCCLSLRSHISSQLWDHKLPIDYLIMLIRFAVIKRVIEVSGPSARVDRAYVDARRCQGKHRSPSVTWVIWGLMSSRKLIILMEGARASLNAKLAHICRYILMEMYQRIHLRMVFRSIDCMGTLAVVGITGLVKMLLHVGWRMAPVHGAVWCCG